MELLEILEALNETHGPSGDEGSVRAKIEELARPFADEVTADTLGNLIVHKKGREAGSKKVLFSAHMDEVVIEAPSASKVYDGTVLEPGAAQITGVPEGFTVASKAKLDETGIAGFTDAGTCRDAGRPYDGTNDRWVMDTFIYSNNVEVVDCSTVDADFAYSDHNPVLLKFRLK